MEDNNELKAKNKNNYIRLLLIIALVLLVTLPFHYVYYSGSLKVFSKDNFTFQHTFVTDHDIDMLIERHNNSNFFDKANIRSESLHKKLTEEGIIVLSNPNEPDYSNEPTENDDSYRAEDISVEYSDNEARANEAYKGKVIQIKGKVRRISEKTRGYAVVIYGQSIGNIMCYLKDKSLVTNYSKGDRLVLKGLCEGYDGHSVIMSDCEVIE